MSVEGHRSLHDRPKESSLPVVVPAVLLGIGAFALYLNTLAPTVLTGDGGEFQFVPYLLGVAHPTGYPLYCLLGWVWSHLLRVGEVAWRMNLFSAFWAAMAVGLLFPTARLLLKQSLPGLAPRFHLLVAALASATFAVTPTFWSQSIIAEVYSFQIFLLVLLVYFLLAWGERRGALDRPRHAGRDLSSSPGVDGTVGSRSLLLAAFCFGLGLAHHSTTVLLVPAILVYLWLLDRRILANWRLALRAAPLALLPLLLYLYIPWRAPHTPYLRLPLAPGSELVLYENRAIDLIQFIMGGPFGGSVDLGVDLGARLVTAWGFVGSEIPWPGLVLGVAGVATLIARRRWSLLALTALALAATVAFNMVYTIGDIHVLYIPAYLILVLWLSLGAGSLIESLDKTLNRFAGRGSRDRLPKILPAGLAPLARIGIILPFLVVPVWMAADRYGELDMSRNTAAREHWARILAEPLPEGAVLVSDDRDEMMPLWYLQYVGDGQQPLRPDLLGLFPLITIEYPTLGHVLDLAMGSGRPVYLTKPMPGIEVKVGVEAVAGLERVVGPAANREPDYVRQVSFGDALALTGYDRSPHSPRPGEMLTISLYWEGLHTLEIDYHSYVHLLDGAGESVIQSDHQPGGVFYPTSLWKPGERLCDDHVLDIAPGTPAGVYRLSVGVYSLSSDGHLAPLGEPVVIGQVGIKTEIQTDPGLFARVANAGFGPIELLGYDAEPRATGLDVSLHWRCLQQPGRDYSVFVHLLDANGQQVAQHDGQPRDGSYPTSIWDVGEVVRDEHILSLPTELPSGDYRLRVGLYLLETGERLPLVGCQVVGIDCGLDFVDLGPVTMGD